MPSHALLLNLHVKFLSFAYYIILCIFHIWEEYWELSFIYVFSKKFKNGYKILNYNIITSYLYWLKWFLIAIKYSFILFKSANLNKPNT